MLNYQEADAKTCTKCGESKPHSEYYKAAHRNGRAAWCKPCTAAYFRGYWKKRNEEGRKRVRTHEHHRRKTLKKKYGLTLEDYNRMFTEQGGVCCICGEAESGNPYGVLEVEHNGQTGRIRGLVCHPCNNAIMWYESAAKYPHLDKVIEYLKRDET